MDLTFLRVGGCSGFSASDQHSAERKRSHCHQCQNYCAHGTLLPWGTLIYNTHSQSLCVNTASETFWPLGTRSPARCCDSSRGQEAQRLFLPNSITWGFSKECQIGEQGSS